MATLLPTAYGTEEQTVLLQIQHRAWRAELQNEACTMLKLSQSQPRSISPVAWFAQDGVTRPHDL